MFSKEVNQINKQLSEKYGRYLDGRQLFRVVWSDDEREYRKGTFNEFHGDLFVRSSKGVRYVPKYNYIKERWILERFIPPPLSFNDELPLSNNGIYEPMYIFEAGGKALEPIWLACDAWVYLWLHRETSDVVIQSAIKEMIEKADAKELQDFRDMIENESNILLHRLHFGEAILNPGVPDAKSNSN